MSQTEEMRATRLWSGVSVVSFSTILLHSDPALAIDPKCRVVDVRFVPQGLPARNGREALSPQIAVWVETPEGKFLRDLFVTRAVGVLGIGNRPGHELLKGDFRWPYGRRPGALPIWAHHRGKTYQKVVMGGRCSSVYPPRLQKDGGTCQDDFNGAMSEDDTTVAYHGPVSSTENYFCSPSGWRTQNIGGVDVVSCASSFYGSKGWYAPGQTSPYPPRADLMVQGGSDHNNVLQFAKDNDVAAVSGATPANGRPVDGIRWYTTDTDPDGNYVMFVEVNIESDFNAMWPSGKCMPEPHAEWNHLGKDYIGQPSVVYKVPFLLDQEGRVSTMKEYAGYGDWQGRSGTINPPDGTISQSGGSGADRLQTVTDDNGTWRVKVSVAPCDPTTCEMPAPPATVETTSTSDATLTVQFAVPPGPPAASYQVRYQVGSPITQATFDQALPAPSTTLGPPGTQVSTTLSGLLPKTRYYVAVRPMSRCGQPGPLAFGSGETGAAQFVTLSGCFVATAAYGSDLEPEVEILRTLRDQTLLKSPIGQLAVATYYSVSPALATVIADHEGLRALSRRALHPLIQFAKTQTRLPGPRSMNTKPISCAERP